MTGKSIALALGIILVTTPAMTDVPDEITYQGRLLQNGNPVTSATDILFELWTQESGGSVAWSDTLSVSPNSEGIYTATLGYTGNPIPDTEDEMWLQVTVGGAGGTMLNPRQKLTSAPFVLNAGTLPNLYVSGNVGIGTSTPDTKLDVDGAITSRQLKINSPGTHEDLDVSGCNTVALTHTTGSVVINGLSGGVAGQVLHIFKVQGSPGTSVTIRHRTSPVQDEQIIVLSNKTDLILGQGDYAKGVTLVNIDGWGWYEIDH